MAVQGWGDGLARAFALVAVVLAGGESAGGLALRSVGSSSVGAVSGVSTWTA